MRKVITIQIEERWQGISVQQYLKKELQITSAQIRTLKFQEDGIQKNGQKCRVTEALRPGDELKITLKEKHPDYGKVEASGRMPDILYEDEDVICIWKPAGRVTHPVAGHRRDTVAGDIVTYFDARKEKITVHSIGRLDKDTAGILIFAKNQIAASRLWEQREQGICRKEYLAWCEGIFPQEAQKQEQRISLPLEKSKAEAGRGRKMQVATSGKRAVTWYQVIKQTGTQALVRLHLETGRTHQIRVHMAYIGHPLVGDALYGAGTAHKDAARLCAWKVRFLQPFTKEEIVLSYPEEAGQFAWWETHSHE